MGRHVVFGSQCQNQNGHSAVFFGSGAKDFGRSRFVDEHRARSWSEKGGRAQGGEKEEYSAHGGRRRRRRRRWVLLLGGEEPINQTKNIVKKSKNIMQKK